MSAPLRRAVLMRLDDLRNPKQSTASDHVLGRAAGTALTTLELPQKTQPANVLLEEQVPGYQVNSTLPCGCVPAAAPVRISTPSEGVPRMHAWVCGYQGAANSLGLAS